MPAVIEMRLSNGNNTVKQIRDFSKAINLAPVPKTLPTNGITSLKSSSMITRVHNVKPGCGSCGRS
jgi:hypothetical protein